MRNALRLRLIALTASIAISIHGLLASSPDEITLAVAGRSNTAPWIAADSAFVAVVWGAAAQGKSDVYIAVSRDAGRSFSSPVRVNAIEGEARVSGEISPRVALLATKSGADPEIAVLWNSRGDRTEIKTARSRDGGQTFDPPVSMQAPNAVGDRGWAALALDREGRAHAIWLDHRGLASERADAQKDHHGAGQHDGVAMAQRSGLYYASSGATPTVERELFKGVCYCCKTALAIGPDGSLYAAWRHVYAGNLRDMAFTVSRDSGKSFSPLVRVSADKWAINGCPDDGPAMAVDGRGVVHVVWPTVVDGATPQGALFYSSSTDGRTFTPRVRVPTLGSPKPSHPQVAVAGDGRLVIAWDEVVDGVRTAVARGVKFGSSRTPTFGSPITLETSGPAVYPVVAIARSVVLAVWTTGGESSVVRVRPLLMP